MHMQQVCGFSQSGWQTGEFLFFNRVLLAGLLSFKDGILALHFCPGHCAIGQIPNDHRQLVDLRREGGVTLLCYTLQQGLLFKKEEVKIRDHEIMNENTSTTMFNAKMLTDAEKLHSVTPRGEVTFLCYPFCPLPPFYMGVIVKVGQTHTHTNTHINCQTISLIPLNIPWLNCVCAILWRPETFTLWTYLDLLCTFK